MRVPIVIKFARILMVSRLRSTRRSFVSRGLTSRPLLIIVLGTGLFVAAMLAGVAVVRFLQTGNLSDMDVQQLVATVIGGAPLFLVGFYFTMGLLWELNASTEAESTDAINWLPVSPTEYVAASSLSTGYTYSPVLMAVLGFSFPISIYTNNLQTYFLLILIALMSAVTGSLAVEVLRSGLARTATAFSRVGGRTMILLRIIGIMSVLVLAQILFSGFIIARIIGNIVAIADIASFIPLLWPTLALTRALGSDPLSSALFFCLSLGFLVFLGRVAMFLRSRYWVVIPGSIHISGPGSISEPGKLASLGLGPAFVAMLRREMRSATRRKEIVRLVVIPIIIPVMIGFPLVLAPTPTSDGTGKASLVTMALGAPFLLGVGLGALILAMTSIGQEGKSLWNLGVLPVETSMVVLSKVVFVGLVSLIGLVSGGFLSALLSGFSYTSLFAFVLMGITLIGMEATLGVAIGGRFPDFSEGPRPKFVTVTGSIIGTVLGLLFMGVTVSPVVVGIALRAFFRLEVPFGISLSISALIGFFLAWVFYKLALGPFHRILSELPS